MMDVDEFEVVRGLLQEDGTTVPPAGFQRPCHRRLLQALQDPHATPVDVAVLLRHVLREETERQHGIPPTVLIPHRPGWPDQQTWERVGITPLRDGGHFRLTAQPWFPAWLHRNGARSLDADAYAGAQRLRLREVPGDPFLANALRTTYRSAGQRDAVRAALAAPPGATLVVNLPTGSGKSLCAQLIALMKPGADWPAGVVVVVVPTIALCLDQQRALEHLVDVPTAYGGGDTEEERTRNGEIRRRVREGKQPIVFTSPESLMGSLRAAVFGANRAGKLRALVIDEAHIVEQWGDEFRSSFQELAGLRTALLRETPALPFRTLLLTATLTHSALETLRALCGRPGPFRVLSWAHLRAEPAFWISHCSTTSEKEARLLEALDHLPRPLIFYTSRVDEAEGWEALLRASGYGRLAVVTGRTPGRDREAAIRNWAHGKLDLVVATSAFGLGIDQAHVRAVVHACIPETVDRFYQEVGRGGRDGRASLSLVVYNSADEATANNLNQKKLISLEKGLPRWRELYALKQPAPGVPDGYRVPLDAVPEYDPTLGGSYHEEWNVRTLTLMCRAGLVALDCEPPQETPADGTAAHGETTTPRARQSWRVVRVLDDDHQQNEAWEDRVAVVRGAAIAAQRRSLRGMLDLLEERKCAAEHFAGAYDLPPSEAVGPHGVRVARACGGCGACRRVGRAPYSSSPTPATWPWPHLDRTGEALRRRLHHGGLLALYVRKGSPWPGPGDLHGVVQWLVEQGVRVLIGPAEITDQWATEIPVLRREPVFCNTAYHPQRLPQLPGLLVLAPSARVEGADLALHPAQVRDQGRPPLILLAREDAPDPRGSGRWIRDAVSCPNWYLDAFRQDESL